MGQLTIRLEAQTRRSRSDAQRSESDKITTGCVFNEIAVLCYVPLHRLHLPLGGSSNRDRFTSEKSLRENEAVA